MSLELNDVLINIRQYIDNPVQGFSQCLEGYKNDQDKMQIFITQCQHLIEKGWDESFQKSYFHDNPEIDYDEVGFLETVLKPLLVDSDKYIFKNKNLSKNAKQAVTIFVKLALLRLLFCAQTDNVLKIENAYEWFSQKKAVLHGEFTRLSQLATDLNIQYNGNTITSIEDLEREIAILNRRYLYLTHNKNWSLQIKGCGVVACVIFAIDRFLRPNASGLSTLSMILIASAIFGALYAAYKQVSGLFANNHDYSLLSSAREPYKDKLNSALFSERIEKFFFITDDEINALNSEERSDEIISIGDDSAGIRARLLGYGK